MNTGHIIGKQISVIASLVLTVAGSEFPSVAQRPSYPVGRRIEQMNRQADQYERDNMHRDGDKKSGGAGERSRAHNVLIQVKEDFDRLQTVYNDIVIAVSAGRKLDQPYISESVADINRCAIRLKTNLALPELKDKASEKPNPKAGQQSEPPLSTLLNHISEFVTNPMFESSGVLNVKLSIKASRDLNEIISLSDSIRKSSEKPR